MKLMIVDDHPRARAMIHEVLAAPGVTICECASGEEAVRRAREFKPDWVTMDVHMPGMNGFQAAMEIQEIHPGVRVVIVTASEQAYFYPLARSIGALGPLRKEECFVLRQMLGLDEEPSISGSDVAGGLDSSAKTQIA